MKAARCVSSTSLLALSPNIYSYTSGGFRGCFLGAWGTDVFCWFGVSFGLVSLIAEKAQDKDKIYRLTFKDNKHAY